MSATTLKKITTEAKRIRKEHPGKSWKAAVKEAGRKYRSGKKKRSSPKRRSSISAVARPARKKRSVKVHRSKKTASQHLSEAKKLLVEKIGDSEARKFVAKTKRAKRKISKTISALKSKVRKLM